MNKLIFLGLFILVGCSFKPPSPTPFPQGGDYQINSINYSSQLNSISSKDNSNWKQIIKVIDYPKDDNIEFWYYAQNADEILLYGKTNQIKAFRDYLRLRMSYKPIFLIEENNRRYISMIAQKGLFNGERK